MDSLLDFDILMKPQSRWFCLLSDRNRRKSTIHWCIVWCEPSSTWSRFATYMSLRWSTPNRSHLLHCVVLVVCVCAGRSRSFYSKEDGRYCLGYWQWGKECISHYQRDSWRGERGERANEGWCRDVAAYIRNYFQGKEYLPWKCCCSFTFHFLCCILFLVLKCGCFYCNVWFRLAQPKGVPLTHGNLMTSVHNIANTYKLSEKDRSLIVMPLFHVHGLIGAVCSYYVCVVEWLL